MLVLSDDAARRMMRRLADGKRAGDQAIVAGESAVAGLVAAIDARESGVLGLDGDSRILVIGSEGATDPAIYAEIVGRPAERVRAAA